MFEHLFQNLRKNIETVQAILKTKEILGVLALGDSPNLEKESENIIELINLIQNIGEKEWRIYDHCAVVTRFYAVYERFVEELISEWLRLLPELVSYSNLEERIKNTHRDGVGRLLRELNQNRFQHLVVERVVRGFWEGVSGNTTYELIPEAFLFHDQNLRKEILEILFTGAGISNAWTWVEKHREVNRVLNDIPGNKTTPEEQLKELIESRNQAAHKAVVDEIFGSQRLIEFGDFITSLCQALAELVTYEILLRQESVGKAKQIGHITEWFKKPQAAVAQLQEARLSVGDTIFMVNKNIAYCCLARVESIQLQNNPMDRVEVSTETEVGLKFNVSAKKGLYLYLVSEEL